MSYTTKKEKIVLVSLFLILLASLVCAQNPTGLLDGSGMVGNGYVVTNDGARIDGVITSLWGSGRGVKRLTIRTPDQKLKFKAADLAGFAVRNQGFVPAVAVLDASESVRKLLASSQALQNTEYIVYQRVLLPSHKNKFALMQLLNQPDARIKIFYSVGSRRTTGFGLGGIPVTGGMARAYWISKDQGRVVKVKRGDYTAKKFTQLFGDCKEMTKVFSRPYHFKEFALHVDFYNQHCK